MKSRIDRVAPAPRTAGFALIAVLVALAILLALLVPFLTSVLNEMGIADHEVSEDQAAVEVRGLRDLTLHTAAQGHRSKEIGTDGGTPDSDGRGEYPARLRYPDAFKSPGAKVMRSAAIEDLQRRIHLPTASPLVLGNLLGLATSLVGEHPFDAETITVAEASRFPEADGALLVYGERINYQRREGNVFAGITRTSAVSRILPEDCQVLDYRVVLAVTYQFERTGRREFVPYSSVAEVQSIGEVPGGPGRFTKAEMDTLLAHCTTHGVNEFAGQWGRELRVFNALDPQWVGPIWYLRCKSSQALGGGAIVRIRSLKDPKQVEYNFVWATQAPTTSDGAVNLQSRKRLNILFPPGQHFTALETVVQPLIPIAVNLNTADREVLVALLQNVRMGPSANQNPNREGGVDPRSRYGLPCDRQMAELLAGQLLELRDGVGPGETDAGAVAAPLRGFEDLCQRFFYPRAEVAKDQAERHLLTTLMDNMLTGRGQYAEMGTMPICFASSSLIRFRAGALRTKLSGLETARNEVSGVASAMPGHELDFLAYRQLDWWDNTRLNRRSPRYLSFPVNLAGIDPGDLGTDPGPTFPAFLFGKLYPTFGLGNSRFPSADRGSIRAATAIARTQLDQKARQARPRETISHESFRFTEHPDGRDLTREGVFDMINTGPRARGVRGRSPRHPDASFPFTTDNEGMPGRHAVSFWFMLDSLGDQCIYDLCGEHGDRNRINLRFEGEHLVFEVLDEAGLDPNPTETQTQPERTAGVWRVATSDFNLQPKVWYHANLSADGNRPDQLTLFVDGVPRHRPRFVTFLNQDLAEYKAPDADTTPAQDTARYPESKVERTEGFPAMGVLRIGRELFEYTSKDDTTFYCRPLDSMGERKARMDWAEYRESLEQSLDEFGRPTINAADLEGTPTEDKTPKLTRGTAVELYGYAAALYRNRPIPVGTTRVPDAVGAWSIARAIIDNPEEIRPQGGNLQIRYSPGKGITETTNLKEIWLVDPLPNEKDQEPPDKSSGTDAIVAGFPTSGGYALLCQQHRDLTPRSPNPAQAPQPMVAGGLELIQYSKRDGNKLTGISRGVTIPGSEKLLGTNYLYDTTGKGRIFISEWDKLMVADVNGEPWRFSDLQQLVLYVVPISLPVSDAAALNNPADTGTVEWAQLYPGKQQEWDTEWVRYNLLTKENYLVRIHDRAWRTLHRTICLQVGRLTAELIPGGGSIAVLVNQKLEFTPPQDDGLQRIGYVDKLEIDFPIVFHARNAFRFRGDPSSGTTSHAFNSPAEVMPCHRLELDWGKLGSLSARVGRNDRVAMVGGTKASGDSRPPMEWHTVNWYWQRLDGDNYDTNRAAVNGVEPERLGPYYFQMIALKDGVQNIFVGPETREDLLDTRRVDRIVKFPSGELPAAYVESAYIGGVNPGIGDYKPATGYVDEIAALGRQAETTLLNVDVSETAMEIPIRKHTKLYSYGTISVARDMTQSWPTDGGLLKIDDEIIAYSQYADGIFKVAIDGRGLLGTEAKPHGDIARVQYLAHIPCAILSGQVSESTNQLVTKDLGGLPRHGGTVLMGRELIHYTWTVENLTMAMPEWHDPDDSQSDGIGLFRGRFGTVPQSGASGSPVIWFPFRFWDRYHKRSDDPELGYYQATRRETPVYFTSLRWTEENPAPNYLQLKTLVNIDQAGSWVDDPQKVRGLFEFERGTVDDQPNPLNWQGSSIEVRFATEYKPAAFDPETFLANGWKQAITVKDLIINYQGQTRILEEEQLAR